MLCGRSHWGAEEKMKKNVLKVFILFLITFNCFAQEKKLNLDFYVPEQEEVNAFLGLNEYLKNFYPNSQIEADNFLNQIFDIGTEYDNILQTNLCLFFVRNTTNLYVRKSLENYCNNNENIPEIFLLINNDLQNSTFYVNGMMLRKIPDGNRICYNNIAELPVFDGKLKTTISMNDWQIEKNNKDNFVCSFEANGEKLNLEYIIVKEKLNKYQKRMESINKNRSEDSVFMKLSNTGILSLSNSQEINLLLEENNKSLTISLFLYSEKYKETFVVKWNYSIEENCIFYDKTKNIYSFLSELILFNWID